MDSINMNAHFGCMKCLSKNFQLRFNQLRNKFNLHDDMKSGEVFEEDTQHRKESQKCKNSYIAS